MIWKQSPNMRGFFSQNTTPRKGQVALQICCKFPAPISSGQHGKWLRIKDFATYIFIPSLRRFLLQGRSMEAKATHELQNGVKVPLLGLLSKNSANNHPGAFLKATRIITDVIVL